MGKLLLIVFGVVFVVVAVVFGGGSMVWWAVGMGKDLSINGKAVASAPADPNATTGWPA